MRVGRTITRTSSAAKHDSGLSARGVPVVEQADRSGESGDEPRRAIASTSTPSAAAGSRLRERRRLWVNRTVSVPRPSRDDIRRQLAARRANPADVDAAWFHPTRCARAAARRARPIAPAPRWPGAECQRRRRFVMKQPFQIEQYRMLARRDHVLVVVGRPRQHGQVRHAADKAGLTRPSRCSWSGARTRPIVIGRSTMASVGMPAAPRSFSHARSCWKCTSTARIRL